MHSYILWKCPVNVFHHNEEVNQEQEDLVFKKQWIQHYKMLFYYLTGNNIYIILETIIHLTKNSKILGGGRRGTNGIRALSTIVS